MPLKFTLFSLISIWYAFLVTENYKLHQAKNLFCNNCCRIKLIFVLISKGKMLNPTFIIQFFFNFDCYAFPKYYMLFWPFFNHDILLMNKPCSTKILFVPKSLRENFSQWGRQKFSGKFSDKMLFSPRKYRNPSSRIRTAVTCFYC